MYYRSRRIEFDPVKNRLNRARHGIDLGDAEPVFFDPDAITIEDADHDEHRWVTVGADAFGRVLVVAYTWRGDRIRMISARRASPGERRQYEANL